MTHGSVAAMTHGSVAAMTRFSDGRNDTLLRGANDICGSNRRNDMASGRNVSDPYNTLNIIYNF